MITSAPVVETSVSQCHHKQSFSGLHSAGRSHFNRLLCSIAKKKRMSSFLVLFSFELNSAWSPYACAGTWCYCFASILPCRMSMVCTVVSCILLSTKTTGSWKCIERDGEKQQIRFVSDVLVISPKFKFSVKWFFLVIVLLQLLAKKKLWTLVTEKNPQKIISLMSSAFSRLWGTPLACGKFDCADLLAIIY